MTHAKYRLLHLTSIHILQQLHAALKRVSMHISSTRILTSSSSIAPLSSLFALLFSPFLFFKEQLKLSSDPGFGPSLL